MFPILAKIRKNAGENKVQLSRGNTAGEIAVKLAIYLIPVLVMGGTWYIRNYLVFGNPVAPYQIELFGRILFPGAVNPATDVIWQPTIPRLFHLGTVLNVWVERWAPAWGGPYYCYDGSRGFGPMFWILLIPSGIFAIFIAFKKKFWDYLISAAVFSLCFFAIPFDWFSRYTIFVCGFGILSFTVVLEYLNRAKAISLIALPIIVLTMIQGNYQFYLTPGMISDFAQRPIEQRYSWDIALINDYSELYQIVLRHKGTTILYSSVPGGFTYPLWDSGFTNKVIAIPQDYTTGETFVDYISKYPASYIITTVDADIVKYYSAGKAKINLIYTKNGYWVFYYPGEVDDKKKN